MNSFVRNSLALVLALLPLLAFGAERNIERIVTLESGERIKVFVFNPTDQGEGPWPLSVLMPGGSANEYIARAQFWLGYEMASRGWVIAVPVSPNSRAFSGDNARKIPEVISQLQQSPEIKPGKSLLMGVSAGGSSALEIASQNPEAFYGVVAVPGIVRENATLGELDGLPVYLRIGENDFLRWNRQLPRITEALEAAGATVNASLMPGANHVFQLNWDELEPWLNALEAH